MGNVMLGLMLATLCVLPTYGSSDNIDSRVDELFERNLPKMWEEYIYRIGRTGTSTERFDKFAVGYIHAAIMNAEIDLVPQLRERFKQLATGEYDVKKAKNNFQKIWLENMGTIFSELARVLANNAT